MTERAGRRRRALGVVCALAALGATPTGARAEVEAPALLPVVRVMVGPAFHVGSSPLVQFMMDVDAGAMVVMGRDMRILLGAELGYTFDNRGLHALNLMLSAGYGRDNLAYVAYQPRMLLGTLDDRFTAGLRNGIGGHFFSDMFDVELGHQFLSTEGRLSQSVTFTVGMNPGAVLYLILDSMR